MTERLYYNDCYLREFRANLVETAEDGRRVYLDRTAFYPTSGGQPFDLGTLGGIKVTEVVDEEDRIAHLLEKPLAAGEVEGTVDWPRRYDHMQQHTGQHVLSAVLIELFKIPTVSFHMSAGTSTIDIGAPSLDAAKLERISQRCAEIVSEARPVSISFEDSSPELGLRKASQRTGTLRIVSIEGLDKSACGGTHVRSTAELGPILLRKSDKMRGNVRLEFVCGNRALRQARADFLLLEQLSRTLSVPPEQSVEIAATLTEKNKVLEKNCQRLAAELAQREGRELYHSTTPDAAGIRRTTQRGATDDGMRARAQGFVAEGRAVFLAVCDDPPSVLLAASADSGVHAGERIKAAVTAAGGRGGGNQALAQGSVPNPEALPQIVREISAA
ncbi:MAG TPA: DHHA1 domain-containing protein [Bryobacteraceae bacterium]|jgi:alanyl-tRNA synthetase|nr:DHHA1 domain-containing protein [Bryobacteraceae bacterium]